MTANKRLPSYIRNRKDLPTFNFPDEVLNYRHMSYCPKDPESLRRKLSVQVGSEKGITIDESWFDNVFMRITHDNYREFRDFSYIREFPHHLPEIRRD